MVACVYKLAGKDTFVLNSADVRGCKMFKQSRPRMPTAVLVGDYDEDATLIAQKKVSHTSVSAHITVNPVSTRFP